MRSISPSSSHQSTVVVSFPDGRTVQGTGEGWRKSDAEISASQAAINQLRDEYPDLVVSWAEINVEAQAGDALIKLSIYLSADIKSASDKSQQLQRLESDFHLAQVFDQWKAQGDSDLAKWGANLGEKRKAILRTVGRLTFHNGRNITGKHFQKHFYLFLKSPF